MPYIAQSKRDVLDPTIKELHKLLVDLELDDAKNNFEGNMNYVITKLIALCYTSPSYREINDVNGMLTSCLAEYNRRVAGPYEAQKCMENGDVYPSPIEDSMPGVVSARKERS